MARNPFAVVFGFGLVLGGLACVRAPAPKGSIAPAPSFSVADGRILIKPRMKYELPLSLHVLAFAEDHHKLFVPWARRVRQSLRPETLAAATTLIRESHEWQLAHLVQGFDGADDIAAIVAFIERDQDGAIKKWAGQRAKLTRALGLTADAFPSWYAGLLRAYYDEGFGREWAVLHRQLLEDDAAALVEQFRNLKELPTTLLERLTGRRFVAQGKLLLYPSSFSRPAHAYGFEEPAGHAALYQVGHGLKGVMSDTLHELLHPLLRGWDQRPELVPLISKLEKSALLRAEWEKNGKGSYGFPAGWLEEMFVHSVAHFAEVEAGLRDEASARKQGYTSFEAALFDAIFERYKTFSSFDAFAAHALAHITEEEVAGSARFVYRGRSKIASQSGKSPRIAPK
jgi:hypothetical protein